MNNLRKNRKTDFRNIIKNGKKENQNRILKIRKIRKIRKIGNSKTGKTGVDCPNFFSGGFGTPGPPQSPPPFAQLFMIKK